MRAYNTAAFLYKLPELPNVPELRAPLDRVLTMLRDGRDRETTGQGAKRRSSYEHQLDRIDGLRFAARHRAGAAQVELGHGIRRTELALPVGRLMHDPYGNRARAVVVYRKLIRELLAWLDANEPLTKKWARALSVPRAMRSELASGYVLPRRSWPAFFVYRAVYDFAVQLLLVLARWWGPLTGAPRVALPTREELEAQRPQSLGPAPRAVAPSSKSEEPQRTAQNENDNAVRGAGPSKRIDPGLEAYLNDLGRRLGLVDAG